MCVGGACVFLCNASPTSASADGKPAVGGVQSDGDKAGEGAAKAEEEEDEEEGKEEENKEEEEGSGETVFLPTGDNKDFRLFRAKLRAGSDEKWQEQLKRNVNVAQLGGQDAWAHELSAPEKGCLIVAKSQEFSMAQTYFNEVSLQYVRGYVAFSPCRQLYSGSRAVGMTSLMGCMTIANELFFRDLCQLQTAARVPYITSKEAALAETQDPPPGKKCVVLAASWTSSELLGLKRVYAQS